MTQKIEISHRTIIFTVFLLLGLWVLFEIRDIIILIFISFILMAALRPSVDRLGKMKIPRLLAVLIVYLFLFLVLGVATSFILPPFVSQSVKLSSRLPSYINFVLPFLKIDLQTITSQIAPIGENLLKVIVGFFSNVFATLTVIVFTFYFLLERKKLEENLGQLIGEKAAEKTVAILREVEESLGAWVRGQFLLAGLIGAMTFVGLTLLGIDYALPLSIIAGALEIVPILGPIISGIPAVLVALTTSPFLALATVALYFIIHQSEGNIVVPLVMNKIMGLPPIATILALMIGGRLGGIVGAILAVPLLMVLKTILLAFLKNK